MRLVALEQFFFDVSEPHVFRLPFLSQCGGFCVRMPGNACSRQHKTELHKARRHEAGFAQCVLGVCDIGMVCKLGLAFREGFFLCIRCCTLISADCFVVQLLKFQKLLDKIGATSSAVQMSLTA